MGQSDANCPNCASPLNTGQAEGNVLTCPACGMAWSSEEVGQPFASGAAINPPEWSELRVEGSATSETNEPGTFFVPYDEPQTEAAQAAPQEAQQPQQAQQAQSLTPETSEADTQIIAQQ